MNLMHSYVRELTSKCQTLVIESAEENRPSFIQLLRTPEFWEKGNAKS